MSKENFAIKLLVNILCKFDSYLFRYGNNSDYHPKYPPTQRYCLIINTEMTPWLLYLLFLQGMLTNLNQYNKKYYMLLWITLYFVVED